MQKVRDLALDLRPSGLDDLGLAAALRWHVDRFARQASLETHLSIDTVETLEPELQTTCFRLAQEALTNVARHARATWVWVDLHMRGEKLELTVRDNGIGFDVRAARERAIAGVSLGLLGMEERVSLVGGEIEILSTPENGTQVRVRLPMGNVAARIP
jgi:signal transduction histidine kinase